jgi:hypothetical protein
MNMTRREIVETRGIMLDGLPATVSGYSLPFAHVRRLDGKGGVVEYAWQTAEHVIRTRGGAFIS